MTFNSRLRGAQFRQRNVDIRHKDGGRGVGRLRVCRLKHSAASVFSSEKNMFCPRLFHSYWQSLLLFFFWWAILSFIFMMSDCLRSPLASFPATFYFHDKSSATFALIRIRVLSTLSYSLVSISVIFCVCRDFGNNNPIREI